MLPREIVLSTEALLAWVVVAVGMLGFIVATPRQD